MQLTVGEAAERAGVASKTIYRAVRSGRLPHLRRHRQQGIRIWSKDLEAWCEVRK